MALFDKRLQVVIEVVALVLSNACFGFAMFLYDQQATWVPYMINDKTLHNL